MESDPSISDQDTNETNNMEARMLLKRSSADSGELLSKHPRHDNPTKPAGVGASGD